MYRKCAFHFFILFIAYSLSFADDIGRNQEPYSAQMKAVMDTKYSDTNSHHIKGINCDDLKLKLKCMRMLLTQKFSPVYDPIQKRKSSPGTGRKALDEDNINEPLNEMIRKGMKLHGNHDLKNGSDAQDILQKILKRIMSYPRVGRGGSQMDDFHLRASFIPRLGRKRSFLS